MMDVSIEKQIKDIFSNFKKRPVAFIGSGISKRYMDTPTWEELLRCTFKEYNDNLAEFGQMLRKHGTANLNAVASIIEEDYDDYFVKYICKDTTHKDYNLYLSNKTAIDNGTIHPYKVYTASVFKNASTNNVFDEEKKEFISFIEKCANVITTNYDTLIERISDLNVIVGNKDFINDKCIGYGELYKVHGCCNKPSSMVLTSKDYQEFDEKKSFYHAKLLLSFIQQPIIFLGYSLNDKYIEEILKTVADMLDETDLEILSKRIIFLEYANDGQTSIREKIIKKLQMTCIKTNEFKLIYKIMTDTVKEGIPLELIRRFQEAVKNFIYEQDNPDVLPVKGIEDIKNPKELTAFHIGVKPVSDNLSLVKTKDLIKDTLYDNYPIGNYDRLVEILISPDERSRFPLNAYIPVYKILKKSTIYKDPSIFKGRKIISDYKDIKENNQSKKVLDFLELERKLKTHINNEEYNQVLITLIVNVNIINDGSWLKNKLRFLYEKDPNILDKSEFRKLACYLDYLENK